MSAVNEAVNGGREAPVASGALGQWRAGVDARLWLHGVLAAGWLVLGWVGWGFAREGGAAVALGVTGLLALVYGAGHAELARLQQQLRAVQQACAQAADEAAGAARLAEVEPERAAAAAQRWLQGLPPPWAAALAQLARGQAVAWPAPVLAPVLAGLLVMLGMLGTFVGLVLTFRGTVWALEAAGGLEGVRAALVAPLSGLGMAFGTSVAGVGASAALGLALALQRRAQQAWLAGALPRLRSRVEVLAPQRQERAAQAAAQEAMRRALEVQAQSLPMVVEQLAGLAERLDARQAQQLAALDARHEAWGQAVVAAVGEALQQAQARLDGQLAQRLQALQDGAQAVWGNAAQALQAQAERTHEQLALRLQAHAAQWAQRGEAVQAQLARAVQGLEEAVQSAQAQGLRLEQAHAQRLEVQQGQALALLKQVEQSHQALAADWAQKWEAAHARARQELQGLAQRLGEAVAEAVAQTRAEVLRLTEHMAQQAQALGQDWALKHEALVQELQAQSLAVVERLAGQAQAELAAQRGEAEGALVRAQAAVAELGALGEGFAQGVAQFAQTQAALVQGLEHVQAVLAEQMARSDEQLALGVAQAREVLELAVGAQQALLQELGRWHAQQLDARAPAGLEGGGRVD